MSGSAADFYASLQRSLQVETQVAVATIVRTRGSSPREVGARMLIRPDGATDGTVGGGCGEAEVWRAALEVMADEQPRMVLVDLTNDIGPNTDGVCGGIMDIFVEPWSAVHAPIGLDIKTETPGEIAVSVGAELLKVRRGGDAASMSDILRPQYRYSLTRGDADV